MTSLTTHDESMMTRGGRSPELEGRRALCSCDDEEAESCSERKKLVNFSEKFSRSADLAVNTMIENVPNIHQFRGCALTGYVLHLITSLQ